MLSGKRIRWLLALSIALLLAPTVWLVCRTPDYATPLDLTRGELIVGPPLKQPAVPFGVSVVALYSPGLLLLLSAVFIARRA